MCHHHWQVSQPLDGNLPEYWRDPPHALGLWYQSHFWGLFPPLELGHWTVHDLLPSHRLSFWWPAKHWTEFTPLQTCMHPSAQKLCNDALEFRGTQRKKQLCQQLQDSQIHVIIILHCSFKKNSPEHSSFVPKLTYETGSKPNCQKFAFVILSECIKPFCTRAPWNAGQLIK